MFGDLLLLHKITADDFKRQVSVCFTQHRRALGWKNYLLLLIPAGCNLTMITKCEVTSKEESMQIQTGVQVLSSDQKERKEEAQLWQAADFPRSNMILHGGKSIREQKV